jgi:Tfp pilus assembly pilus retraction ATPase PilT
MPSLQLDRLLETCYRREATHLILKLGLEPAIWMAGQWRQLQLPPVTESELAEVAGQLTQFVGPPDTDGDKKRWEFDYGDVARFRASTFEHDGAACFQFARLFSDRSGGPPPTASRLA